MIRTAILAMVALTLALTAGAAAAAPTSEQLAAARITAADAGAGFTVYQSGTTAQLDERGVPNTMVLLTRTTFSRGLSVQMVISLLADDAALTQAAGGVEDNLATVTALGLTLQRVEAPALGRDTERFLLSGTIFGISLDGDCIGWRHAGVFATVCAVGGVEGGAFPLAQKQHDRLVAAFGPE